MRTSRRGGVLAGSIGKLEFSFSGAYSFLDDGDGNYRYRFLSSGILTVSRRVEIDAFLVGGGAGGRRSTNYGGGGGGGLTLTCPAITLRRGTNYQIVVAATQTAEATAGNATSAFGCTANGGGIATAGVGGSGGSGGGSGGLDYQRGKGGTDGGNGAGPIAGAGQGSTTREFGLPSEALYAGGGGGYDKAGGAGGGGNGYSYSGTSVESMSAENNTGGGAGGASSGAQLKYGYGGSGIVVIRNHRTA